jgi:hypothetical protein
VDILAPDPHIRAVGARIGVFGIIQIHRSRIGATKFNRTSNFVQPFLRKCVFDSNHAVVLISGSVFLGQHCVPFGECYHFMIRFSGVVAVNTSAPSSVRITVFEMK